MAMARGIELLGTPFVVRGERLRDCTRLRTYVYTRDRRWYKMLDDEACGTKPTRASDCVIVYLNIDAGYKHKRSSITAAANQHH